MPAHYVCTGGCGAQVNEPGICEDEKCLMYNMDFEKCSCKDNKHDEVLKATPDDFNDEEGWGSDEIELDEDEVAKWGAKFGETDDDHLYN